jgi:hypothetical protein
MQVVERYTYGLKRGAFDVMALDGLKTEPRLLASEWFFAFSIELSSCRAPGSSGQFYRPVERRHGRSVRLDRS